jgi:hypothetical protein
MTLGRSAVSFGGGETDGGDGVTETEKETETETETELTGRAR